MLLFFSQPKVPYESSPHLLAEIDDTAALGIVFTRFLALWCLPLTFTPIPTYLPSYQPAYLPTYHTSMTAHPDTGAHTSVLSPMRQY